MTSLDTRPQLIDPVELAERLGLRRPTEEQADVIGAPFQPALVTAGAGSGKTETMAARVVWLVANGLVRPEQVLGLTFTRKAAGQLADRVRRRLRVLSSSSLLDELDPSGDRRTAARAGEPTVSTYHAYAGRLLTEHGLRLPTDPGARLLSPTASWQLAHRIVATWAADLDTDRVPATVTALVQALAGELGEHLADPDALRAHAERFCAVVETAPPAKGQRAPLPLALEKLVAAQRFRVALLPLIAELAARKRAERCMDFADQMAAAARLADEHPEVGEIERGAFRAVLLDEYQDTGHAQRVLLRALFAGDPSTTVTAVGDPFQSIYGWRGASAANLPRFVTDFPRPDPDAGRGEWAAAPRHGLLTSFRNPPEVLALANGIAEPLRALDVPGDTKRSGAGPTFDRLRPRPGAPAGDVRVALHPDVETERAWLADAVADRWRAAADRGDDPPTSAVLVRRRADMTALAAALRERDLPVEVVGLGGLLDEPEVRDVVSALRLVVDPLAGGAAVRLLTGARWRIGGADLAALWRRARELASPGTPGTVSAGVPDPVQAALPGEHAERAGLVDALDDPGPPARYSATGYARLRRLAGELTSLRRRVTAPLVDLVADVERVLLLDVETAARPGPTGRAHLDAFADVVADFSAGATSSGGTATATALLAYLDAAEEAEDGLTPGEVDVAEAATGGTRVQVLTVHAAKGLEWELVALPHVCDKVFPGTKRSGSWLSSVASLPVELRGDRPDLPVLDLDGATDRKEVQGLLEAHERAFDERRLVEERRLFYVALTRAERVLLVSGHWWGETGDSPRGPSDLLAEVGALAAEGAGRCGVVDVWAEPPEEGAANPMADAVHEAAWPQDPLGSRRVAVDEGAALVRSRPRAPVRRRRDGGRDGGGRPRRLGGRRRRAAGRAGGRASPARAGPAAAAAVGEPARRSGRRPGGARAAVATPGAATARPAGAAGHRVPRVAGAVVLGHRTARVRPAARGRRRRGRRGCRSRRCGRGARAAGTLHRQPLGHAHAGRGRGAVRDRGRGHPRAWSHRRRVRRPGRRGHRRRLEDRRGAARHRPAGARRPARGVPPRVVGALGGAGRAGAGRAALRPPRPHDHAVRPPRRRRAAGAGGVGAGGDPGSGGRPGGPGARHRSARRSRSRRRP